MPKGVSPTVDPVNLEIIRRLWDGRTPYSKIAKALGLTTNTVRTRVNKLIKSGILQIIGIVEIGALPGHSAAFVGFRIQPPLLKKAAETIRKLKGVVVSASVSGRYDLMAVVMFNEDFTQRDFFYQEMAKVEGLISTETFFVFDSTNFNLRYVL